MERIKKSCVVKAFGLFCECYGLRVASSYKDVGAYRLDYAGIYGGYNIECIMNKGGGIYHPFGSSRRSRREMFNTLHFAIDMAREKKRTEGK